MMDWSRYHPYFTPAEFRCKHTGKEGMDAEFMDKLLALRLAYGKPMTITSGYRHPTHPVEARKQRSDGEHTRGRCADIACGSSAERYQLIRLAMAQGWPRIGIAKTFIHLGLGGPGLPPNVLWEYA